jgi:hypothetical protein
MGAFRAVEGVEGTIFIIIPTKAFVEQNLF